MNWTTEPPTEPGEYYVRTKIVVTEHQGTLVTVDAIGDLIEISEIDYFEWWPERIPEPPK